jgi:hypothetical protein
VLFNACAPELWRRDPDPDTVTALMAKMNRHNESVTPPTKPLPHARLHDLRHLHATTLQMSRVASAASFGRSREHVLSAAQRAALGQARGHRSPRNLRDLGCHHPLASNRTMMQPVRLQQIPA